MKQVKGLILAAILVCTLSGGVQAGDMGSPGMKTACSSGTYAGCETPQSPDQKQPDQKPLNLDDPIIIQILFNLLALI